MSCGFSSQHFSFTGQTASISAMTLFSPTQDSTYIVLLTGYAVGYDESNPNHPAIAIANIGWTSNYAQPGLNSLEINGDAGAEYTSTPLTSFVIRSLSGTPVTFSCDWYPATGYSGTQSYDVYITVLGG